MYDLYSKFDFDEHKKNYIHYLEVVILPDGTVEYAIPSHQEKLIKICCDKFKVSRQELADMCPPDYYFDFITWLCDTSECVSVWTNFIKNPKSITDKQLETLNKLKEMSIYEGEL